ncbi:MAG TPA: glycosyltransferase family 1 protein, partial [Thermomicrobiales bacterium]|nr:glycosyltransferase family 1 protein [Thermomicrobiales bacterium]
RDIERVLGISPERIRVTPLAADPSLRPAEDGALVRARVAKRFGIAGPYMLSIAGFDRRKNVPLLVRAFARALPDLPGDVTLVLAGAPHSGNSTVFPPVEPVIREEGIVDRVVLTGKVTNDERTSLYQGAIGYVTPSEYEGFGLTALEAMACGVPVIAANRTSLPEVIGDAGMLVEPEIDDLAVAIARLVTDLDLRARLSRSSLGRATEFSWDRTAQLTVQAYRQAGGR